MSSIIFGPCFLRQWFVLFCYFVVAVVVVVGGGGGAVVVVVCLLCSLID